MIESLVELKRFEFKEVTVKGVYKQLNVHQRSDKESFVGYVKIELDDGFVALKGKRTAEEISLFENKEVVVNGMFNPSQQLWRPGASPVVPMILPIKISLS